MTAPSLVKAGAAACIAALICLSAGAVRAQVNVTTYHYDTLRTGWNPNETTLTQNSFSNFGLLQSVTLDDQVDAQPLLVSNETINGSQHNVLYVATENNSIYALDAQSGQILLQTNLGPPVPYTDLPEHCGNNGPNVGINSTPVIDPSAQTLYVIALTLQNNNPVYYLHALGLTTLSDLATPVAISASGELNNGQPYQFSAHVSRQRAGLLLANGNVYAGFASFCDFAANKSRGWVLGWNAGSLAPLASNQLNNKLATSPDNFFLSSVWMSGYGLAASSAGFIFFVTGNSDPSGNVYSKVNNISESVVEMNWNLTARQGLYTPTDHNQLDRDDEDFGSGGVMLLPPQSGNYPDLAVAAGKEGTLYLLDADNLKKAFGTYDIGRCWCGPSYYEGSDGLGRVVTSGNSTVIVWAVEGTKAPSLVGQSEYSGIANGQHGGFFTSVSSNGTTAGTAVVWAVGRPTDNDPAYVDLYAVNPDTGQLLFSDVAGQWPNTTGDANLVPVVANGLVYVASDQTLTIFGPGGGRARLPKIRHIDMRAPLSPGQHEIYGTVRSISSSAVVVQKRGGEQVRIDPAEAKRASHFAPPSIGQALFARGTYDKAGVLEAQTIGHAVDRPAMWPLDR